METLKGEMNQFSGVVVDCAALPEDGAEFAARLDYSLGVWKTGGAKVVWFAAPRRRADLIPVAVARGFVFHHALEDSLQMTLTLVPGAFIPPFATHYVGAGGVVLRDNGEILVVSERYKMFPGRRLKLPGGALQAGEHIGAAVVREVKEETGIDARFESVVCLRQWHGYRYGKSDIYFVCRLTPLSTEILMDAEELVECLWLPVEDYLADADVHPFNKLVVRSALGSKGISRKLLDEYKPEVYEILVP